MERDFGREIDQLRREIEALKGNRKKGKTGKVWLPEAPNPGVNIHPLKDAHPDPRLSALMEELCQKAEEDRDTGAITYLGVFASGGRQSNWIRNEVSTDELLGLIANDMAPKALACIGSGDRLRMLLALLKGACSVTQLVEQCGFSSTGQAYHHLKPLLAADLIEEDERERGFYTVRPHRVQGIIMVLAGICDMLDAEYTRGAWEAEG
jgi:DNA gyrase subunit B